MIWFVATFLAIGAAIALVSVFYRPQAIASNASADEFNGFSLVKKYDDADLSKQKSMFFFVGLVISLLATTAIIEYAVKEVKVEEVAAVGGAFEDEIFDVPITTQAPPPPPQIQVPQIVEVPDDEIIEEQQIEFNEEKPTEATPYEPTTEEVVEETVEEAPIDLALVQEPPVFSVEVMKYVNENFKVPSRDIEEGNSGKIMVKFVVNKEGNITNVEVLRGINERLDEEAKRVVKSLPKAKPGKNAGAPCQVRYIIPIKLKFD